MKILARKKSDQNKAAVDPWTLVHFAVGLAAGLVEMPIIPALALAAAYEVFEHMAESSEAGADFFNTSGAERIPNVAVDLGIFVAGHAAGKAWNKT